MIYINKHIVPKGYLGISIFPFIILKDKALLSNKTLLNHERIHLKQQMELLIIPFLIFYSLEFVFRLVYYKKWCKAYENISFEREAYLNEKDLNYLKSRSLFSFINYL